MSQLGQPVREIEVEPADDPELEPIPATAPGDDPEIEPEPEYDPEVEPEPV